MGSEKEAQAALYLRGQGYEILTANYRNRFGEIDLIGREKGVLCFIEVKYRSSRINGSPEEAVSYHKMSQISKVAQYYLMRECGTADIDCRFDVVSIYKDQITLYRNAFEAVL